MKLKICLVLLCLLSFRSLGLPQFHRATIFMPEIIMNKGFITVLDEDDFQRLKHFHWRVMSPKNYNGKVYNYVYRTQWKNNIPKCILMHREIMGVTDTKILVDHKNHNTLDNTKDNLRVCTRSQNCSNCRPIKKAGSRFTGVQWNKLNRKWIAKIVKNRKQIYLGSFLQEEDAALAYNNAAIKYHGEFASLNVISL